VSRHHGCLSHRGPFPFRGISPQAPAHALVIPEDHYPDLAALASADDGGLLTELAGQVREAEAEGISGSGYRVVFNTGAGAGQAVPHVHAHVPGGRGLGWPRAERSAGPGLTPARIA
jgi:histidine triad (HIT) family protein